MSAALSSLYARSLAALVGAEVVDLVEVGSLDLFERHEFGNIDGVRRFLFQRLELLGSEQDVLAFGELVPFNHVLPGHDLAGFGSDVLLLEPGPVFLGDEIEGNLLGRLRRRVELYRDGNEPKADGSGAHWSRTHGRNDST